MTVCVVNILSESGDRYDPLVCDKTPTDSQLKKLLQEACPPEEFEAGPGIFGTFLYVDMYEVEIHTLK